MKKEKNKGTNKRVLIIAVIFIIILVSMLIIKIVKNSTLETSKEQNRVIVKNTIEIINNNNINEEIYDKETSDNVSEGVDTSYNSNVIAGYSNKLSDSEIEAIKKLLGQENSKNTGTTNNSETSNQEQKKYNIYVSEIIEEKQIDKNETDNVKLLGNPLKENVYKDDSVNNIIARNIWDMQLYNNKIYFGSGDYDTNKGPVHIYYYDIENETFVDECTIPDEQIGRIMEIDGILYIPGIDPKEGWDLGNYYTYDGIEWVKHRNLPGGLHNFDILKKDNMIYAAVGLDDGAISVAVSKDNGETFELVSLIKNGEEIILDNAPRVYDVFEFKGEVYAIDGMQYGLYRYDTSTNKFLYCEDKQVYTKGTAYGTLYAPLERKICYKENMIFTCGTMTFTNDLKEYNELKFDKTTLVRDVKIENDKLQILCQTYVAANDYIISIYETSDNTLQNWDLKFYFKSSDEIRSFEVSDNVYYFGVGTTVDKTTAEGKVNSGNILKVEL